MISLIGKHKDIIKLLNDAIKAGYGHLPAELCIRLYLARN